MSASAPHPTRSHAPARRDCLRLRAWRVFAVAAALLLAGRSAADAADPVEVGSAEFASAPDALQAYATRAAALRRQALADGSLSYIDVIDAAYGAGAITEDIFTAKARWRAHLSGLVFVSDYARVLEHARVGSLVPVADARLQSTLVAQYESISDRITLAPIASDFAVFHECGHALQRATLRVRGTADSRRPDLPDVLLARESRHPTLQPTEMSRLEYLCSQVELEVRLQDLNRFQALLTGRPIMTPLDAVHAITALGIPLSYEETRDAMAVAGESLGAEQFAAAVHADRRLDAGRVAIAFEDARELRIVRRLALRLDPACWAPLLAKILFEAPGHL